MRRSSGQQIVCTSYILLVLLNLVVGFLYRPSETFFSQDDFWFLDRVRRADSLSGFWTLVSATDYFYRPVPRVLLLKFQHLLFDLQPFAFHAFSWLIHVANCGMLFGLWRVLWRNEKLGFIAALYYGLHYVQFVPVSWVSGLQELSVLFWSLLSILAYVHNRKFGRRWSLALSLLAFALSVFSKESGLVVLVFVALVDVVLMPNARSGFLRGKIGFLGIAIAYLWIRTLKVGGLPSSGPYAWHFDLVMVWRNLSWYITEGLYMRAWTADNPYAGSLIVLGIGLLLLYIFSRFSYYRRPLIVGGIGFLGALAPVLFLNRTYSYYFAFPLLGFSLLLAVIVDVSWTKVQQRAEDAAPVWRAFGRTAGGLILIGWIALNYVGLIIVQDQDPLGLRDKARISQRAIDEVLILFPHLPEQSTLYIRGASERDFWAMGKGSLFSLYYYPRTIEVLFDIHTPLTADLLAGPDLFIYDFK